MKMPKTITRTIRGSFYAQVDGHAPALLGRFEHEVTAEATVDGRDFVLTLKEVTSGVVASLRECADQLEAEVDG